MARSSWKKGAAILVREVVAMRHVGPDLPFFKRKQNPPTFKWWHLMLKIHIYTYIHMCQYHTGQTKQSALCFKFLEIRPKFYTHVKKQSTKIRETFVRMTNNKSSIFSKGQEL